MNRRKIARGNGLLSPKLERNTQEQLILDSMLSPMPKALPQVGGTEVQSKFLNNAYVKQNLYNNGGQMGPVGPYQRFNAISYP